jgi:hypothetical protein
MCALAGHAALQILPPAGMRYGTVQALFGNKVFENHSF